MKKRMMLALCSLLAASGLLWAKDEPGDKTTLPKFEELYSLIQSSAAGVNETELNRAAVIGLLEQLSGTILLVTNAPAEVESQAVLKTALFDEAYGYLRVGRVESGLAEQVRKVHAELQSTNKLKGLVLDLRFATGQNYAEAAAVANLFLKTDQALLELGPDILRSETKSEVITVPAAVLVNEKTIGAAEALAAVMRQAVGSIVIGQPTAGQARVFTEFKLTNGQRVRLATGAIRLGDGSELRDLAPDVRVAVSLEEEQAFLADPFRARLTAQGHGEFNGAGGLNLTNRLRRPRSESELIRMRREGFDFEADVTAAATDIPAEPVLSDPSLARAVDFLKGLALVKNRR